LWKVVLCLKKDPLRKDSGRRLISVKRISVGAGLVLLLNLVAEGTLSLRYMEK
jgi:hypothetical protein